MATNALLNSGSVPESESHHVKALERALHRGTSAFVSASGERIRVPDAVFKVLREAVGYMANGQAVTLVPSNQAVTTQRAAVMLGMSRPYFVKLLEDGILPYHRVGNQRRVYLGDVVAYGAKRDAERSAALTQLARDAYEAGLYEDNRP